ncbi:YeeE/YedE thiosulfate transporter family protein [Cyanobium sp. Morenito 9A2]|nr:YeeE/YedE family protein [Cyanobium sp. Morenito 9A2]
MWPCLRLRAPAAARPPDASLPRGAFLFGVGMVLARGCGTGTLAATSNGG